MKATIDKELCTDCELCVDSCPEVFETVDKVVSVKVAVVPDKVKDSCRQAAQDCPAEAIKIEE